MAIAKEVGQIIHSVASVSGNCRSEKNGSSLGSAAMSPTVRIPKPKYIETAVSTEIVTSGDNAALAMKVKAQMITRPMAVVA